MQDLISLLSRRVLACRSNEGEDLPPLETLLTGGLLDEMWGTKRWRGGRLMAKLGKHRLQFCRCSYLWNKQKTENAQPVASALHPASPSLQREFSAIPGLLHQQTVTFYHPQDFRTGVFKRLFLAHWNGTSADPDAEAGGLRVVRGGTQAVLLWSCLANKPQSEAKTRKRNSILSCSSSRWGTESRHHFSTSFFAIPEAVLLALYKREREIRNCLCFIPFFVHIWLNHLSRTTLASHVASLHPFFTSSLWCSACAHSLSVKFHFLNSPPQATRLQQKRQAKWRKVRSGGEAGLRCSWGSHSHQGFQVLLAH